MKRNTHMANEEKDISRIISEGTLIDKAIVLAARNAVKEHIQKGQPLVICATEKLFLSLRKNLILIAPPCININDLFRLRFHHSAYK